MAFDIDVIKSVYSKMSSRINNTRKSIGRPLTLAEKILYSHLWDESSNTVYERGLDYVDFGPDRVTCQDATAQMALLQFMQAGKDKVAVPTTVHCDHLILAQSGAQKDLRNANKVSSEVFNYSARFGPHPKFGTNPGDILIYSCFVQVVEPKICENVGAGLADFFGIVYSSRDQHSTDFVKLPRFCFCFFITQKV